MTTAIARIENGHNTAAIERHEDRAPSFSELVSMGDVLVRTGFLPQHIKNGAQAAAIIMTGRELGMEPMRALRSLSMVKGKVVEDAASQLARFKAAGGKAHFVSLDETKAELRLTHPNGDVHAELFTIADAKRAGLSGDNWQKYPRAMLRSRCITAGLKSIGWDGAVGAYDPDEARAFVDGTREAVVASDEDDERERVHAVKTACVVELTRLGVTDEKEQRAKVRGLNAGTMPELLEDWEEVLGVLKETSTPDEASGENSQSSD